MPLIADVEKLRSLAALRSPLCADLRRGRSRGACCSFWSDLAWAPEPAMSPEHPKRSIPLCLSRGLSGVVLGLPAGDIVFGHEVVRRRRQLGCRLAADETAEVSAGQRLRFGVVFRHPGGGSLRSMPARPMSVGIRSTWPVGVVIPSGAGDTPGPFTSSGTAGCLVGRVAPLLLQSAELEAFREPSQRGAAQIAHLVRSRSTTAACESDTRCQTG